ncbi:MAG: hypothetical protein WCI92_04130 [Bacteroidota bacterium]
MKKSNRILIGIFLFAVGWLITYNILVANVLKTIPGHGFSRFGHLSQQEVVMKLKPFDKIKIKPQGSPKIYITQSDTSEMSMGDGYSEYLVTSNSNGLLSITMKKPLEEVEEIIHIKVPHVTDISIDQQTPRFENESSIQLSLENFRLTKLDLMVLYPYDVEFRNCEINKLKIQGKLLTGYTCGNGIRIEPTNRIDSLAIDLEGKGVLSISKAGELYNQVNVSDSIRLNASMLVIKKILVK